MNALLRKARNHLSWRYHLTATILSALTEFIILRLQLQHPHAELSRNLKTYRDLRSNRSLAEIKFLPAVRAAINCILSYIYWFLLSLWSNFQFSVDSNQQMYVFIRQSFVIGVKKKKVLPPKPIRNEIRWNCGAVNQSVTCISRASGNRLFLIIFSWEKDVFFFVLTLAWDKEKILSPHEDLFLWDKEKYWVLMKTFFLLNGY